MLFAGQVYEVEMACLFYFDWGALLGARGCLLGSCGDDRALQDKLCFQEAGRKDGAFDMSPFSSFYD